MPNARSCSLTVEEPERGSGKASGEAASSTRSKTVILREPMGDEVVASLLALLRRRQRRLLSLATWAAKWISVSVRSPDGARLGTLEQISPFLRAAEGFFT